MLNRLTISELTGRLAQRACTAREAMQGCLDQIQRVDRLGMEEQFVKILGVDIPHIIIPVRPGRDLARLIEVAAFQTKLKRSGYNPAKELNDRLISQMSRKLRL